MAMTVAVDVVMGVGVIVAVRGYHVRMLYYNIGGVYRSALPAPCASSQQPHWLSPVLALVRCLNQRNTSKYKIPVRLRI